MDNSFFTSAAQVLPVLFLAVIFDVFGKGRARSPFGLGLHFQKCRPRAYTGWLNAQLVFGLLIFGVAGEALALNNTGSPVVAGALVYFAVLVFIRPSVWALRQIGEKWIRRHEDKVVHAMFLAPLTFAVVAMTTTAAIHGEQGSHQEPAKEHDKAQSDDPGRVHAGAKHDQKEPRP